MSNETADNNAVSRNETETTIAYEVKEITPEVSEIAEWEALESGKVVTVNTVETTDD